MSHATCLVYPDVNRALAARLERAEARACVSYLETERRLDDQSSVAWKCVAGVDALFDGVPSPLTQSFGLGLSEPVKREDLEELEAFFGGHGAVTAHEVSVLAHPSTWDVLAKRGYAPVEASTVLVRPTDAPATDESPVTTRIIGSHESDLWASIFAEGVHEESVELGRLLEQLGRVIAHSSATCFLAELAGQPIAAAVVNLQGEIAVLGGARTIRAARRQGAQAALLAARLRFASDHQAPLAMIVAGPGSQSQRNAERQGFRPTYTRAKWELRTIRTRA